MITANVPHSRRNGGIFATKCAETVGYSAKVPSFRWAYSLLRYNQLLEGAQPSQLLPTVVDTPDAAQNS